MYFSVLCGGADRVGERWSPHQVHSWVSCIYNCTLGSGVHVQTMQDCCIGTYMAMRFAASITPSSISGISPHVIPPQPPNPPWSLPCCPTTDPSVWCSPPYVHGFSLFNTHLWVRTCSVWFSVLVSACWEWWFPDSSMSLQRTQLIIFYGCIVFQGIYVPHFPCPVYYQWAFGLVLGLCYCK